MQGKGTKTAAGLLAALLLTGTAVLPARAADTAALSGGKEEIVYANLQTDGSVGGIYVVNHFDVLTAGTVTDYGGYTALTNLTDTSPLTQEGDAVTFSAGEGNFYYQGTLTRQVLPWSFAIGYTLDGRATDAAALAGASGALEIRIQTRQNKAVDSTFYDNYMLQITVTLDPDKCADIDAGGGTAAASGKDRVITYTVLPGKDADITLKAAVTNFSLSGISVAAVPFSSPVAIPDTSGLVDETATLSDAVSSLNNGIAKLVSGSGDLNDGVAALVSGSGEFQAGLAKLSGGSAALLAGSAQIKSALAAAAAQLSGGTGAGGSSGGGLGAITQLPAGLRQLADGLGQVSAGLTTLQTSYASLFSALDAAIMAIPAGTVTQADIQGLYAAVTDPAQLAALQQLVGGYTAAQTVLGTYTTKDAATQMSLRDGLRSVSASLGTLAANIGAFQTSLNTTADTVEASASQSALLQQLQTLAAGLSSLSSQYGTFHDSLAEYVGGVDALSAHYKELNTGLTGLQDGTASLAQGTGRLYKGSKALADATADLPDTVQVEIDKLTADYDTSDFTPVSFVSAKNTDVSYVQFICMTASIEEPEKTGDTGETVLVQTFWDRLLALFQ